MDIFSIDFSNFTNYAFYLETILFMIIGYLIGSINFGHLISKYKNNDLGRKGSMNYGATNAGRTFGWKGFVFVFVGDFLKILLAAGIMIAFLQSNIFSEGSIALGLLFAIVGHNYPVYFNFKGGKGVASFIAAAFVINYIAAILGLLFFVLALLIFRKVSVSSMSFSLFTSIFVTIISVASWQNIESILPFWSFDFETVLASWMITTLVIFAHRSNIRNWYIGEERSVRVIEEAVHSWRERIVVVYERFVKNFSIYYSNTRTINQDYSKSTELTEEVETEEELKIARIEQNFVSWDRSIFFQKSIENKRNINVHDWRISPTTGTMYIVKLNNVKKLSRFQNKKMSIDVNDAHDLDYVIKHNKHFDLICNTNNNYYYAEKLIKNNSKVIQVDPIKNPVETNNDLWKILKKIEKTKSTAVLDFDYSKLSSMFLLKNINLDPEIIFLNKISKTILQVEEKFPNLKNIIISINFNYELDILKIVSILSVVYDYPIILNIDFNYWKNPKLQVKLKDTNLINYFNIY